VYKIFKGEKQLLVLRSWGDLELIKQPPSSDDGLGQSFDNAIELISLAHVHPSVLVDSQYSGAMIAEAEGPAARFRGLGITKEVLEVAEDREREGSSRGQNRRSPLSRCASWVR